MTDWVEKVWGRTRLVFDTDNYQRHELQTVKGGFCSVHYHESRASSMEVVSGVLSVVTFFAWKVERIVLTKGMEIRLPSLVPHMFQVVESGEVVEDYWPDRGGRVRSDDIVRLISGGMVGQPEPVGTCPLWREAMDDFIKEVS